MLCKDLEDAEAFLIDFADEQGATYAMETVPAERLIPLLYKPVELQTPKI
jgi:hypothetical protein